jgi:hypothetical protein
MKTKNLSITTVLFFSLALALLSFNSSGQIMIEPGVVVSEGDTLQLGKATMGKVYFNITFKYVGVPSLMIKRKGPLLATYEGNVVFVDKVIQDKGMIILKGIPSYKLECDAVKAFKDGEVKKFKR